MAEIYTVRSILGDEGLQKFINEGKSKEEIINIAKAYKDEALKSGDKDALSKMNLVNEKQGRADFFTRLGDDLDANGYESLAGISRSADILASKVAAPIAGLMGDSDKEAQFLADARLTQSINEAKNLDKIATTGRTQKEYKIDSNNLLANAIGSYANDSQTYARNLIEEAQQNNYTAMDRINIGMATTANATKYFIKSFFYGEDSKQAKDIKDAQKILEASRDAYQANNPGNWNIAGFAGEMITDPLNVVGLAKGFKIANSAFKKGANVAFDLAQLGAIGGIAGAISEYGSYKEKDEQNIAGAAMMGATSGVALGAGFMALGAGLAKIASRFGDKSTLETNTQMAKDETLKTMEQTDTPKDTDERLKKISDDIEEAFGADENGENIARLLGQEYDIHINQAIKQSQEVSAAIDSSVSEFASANPNASASDIEIYINKAYAPSQNEKELTRIINGGKPVTPRMAGYRVLGVLQKTMEYKRRFDRDTVVKRFKNHGFSDELANVFAEAYIADDISVARRYLDSKIASNREKSVDEGRNEWLEITTKDKQAAHTTKEPKQDQEQIYNDITSKDMPFYLIDDMDMTPQLQSRLEKDGYTLERESQSGVWEISKASSDKIAKDGVKSTEFAELIFQDKKGKDHIITKEIQKEWMDTFGLKNLDDTYIPKFNNEIKKVLGDKKLKLQKGSLLKLVSQGRQKFIPEIKKVLDDPEIIITDKNGEFILAKHLKDKDYFVNVSFDNGEYLVSISNGIKEINNLNNKIKQGGRILYQSPNANFISQTLLQTSQYSANKIDNKTIPNQDLKSADESNQISLNLSRAERRAMGIEEPKGKTLVIDEKAVKSDGFVASDENIKNLVKNISSNKDMAMQLQPKADLLKLVKDFSKVIKTPIFDSKISIDKLLNHLADKNSDKRLEYLNLIKPTLENPLFITKENNRYRFVKTFIDSDKITKFLSVIENDNGEFIGITATPIKNTDLKNLLKGDIVWGGDTLSTLNAPQIAKQEVEAISETIPNQDLKSADESNQTSLNLSRAERRAMGIEEPKGKTLVIDEKAVKSDVREFGRLAHQVGLGFKSAKEAKAVMDKCDKSKFDCGS